MKGLTDQQRGTLVSTMSDASCGLILGRSVGWVVRMRRELECAAPTPPVQAVEAATPKPEARSPKPGSVSGEGVRQASEDRGIEGRIRPAVPAAARAGADRPHAGGGRAVSGVAKPGRGAMPSEDIVAAAISAACRLRGVDVTKVNDSGLAGRRARQLAVAALHARFGTPNIALAQRLTPHGPELAPSMLVKAGITTDDLLSVVEALGTSEPSFEAVPMAASAPVSAVAGGLNPAAPPPFVPRERKAPKASAPRSVAPMAVVLPVKPCPAPDRPARSLPAPRPPSAQPKPLHVKPAHVVRLKPVTPVIARWARAFLASPIWTVDEVADLFGVHPDGLTDALQPLGAA